MENYFNMEHHFNINVAIQYGVHCAVIFHNMLYWTKTNKANGENFYDGYTWTFNSHKALSELFPYMTKRQIQYALKQLIDDGIIITGNYNKSPYDKTTWYAITEKGYSMMHNSFFDDANLYYRRSTNVSPIPNINTDINTDNKLYIEQCSENEAPATEETPESEAPATAETPEEIKPHAETKKPQAKAKKTAVDFSAIMDEREIKEPALRNAINDFIEDRKDRKKPFTKRSFTQFLNELKTLEPTSIERQVIMIKNAILHSWLTVYPIKTNNSYSKQDGPEYCKRAPEDEIELDFF